MCTNWSVIADIDSDSLEMCFKIMDAYIVLCASNPEQFTQVIYGQWHHLHLMYILSPPGWFFMDRSLDYIIVM